MDRKHTLQNTRIALTVFSGTGLPLVVTQFVFPHNPVHSILSAIIIFITSYSVAVLVGGITKIIAPNNNHQRHLNYCIPILQLLLPCSFILLIIKWGLHSSNLSTRSTFLPIQLIWKHPELILSTFFSILLVSNIIHSKYNNPQKKAGGILSGIIASVLLIPISLSGINLNILLAILSIASILSVLCSPFNNRLLKILTLLTAIPLIMLLSNYKIKIRQIGYYKNRLLPNASSKPITLQNLLLPALSFNNIATAEQLAIMCISLKSNRKPDITLYKNSNQWSSIIRGFYPFANFHINKQSTLFDIHNPYSIPFCDLIVIDANADNTLSDNGIMIPSIESLLIHKSIAKLHNRLKPNGYLYIRSSRNTIPTLLHTIQKAGITKGLSLIVNTTNSTHQQSAILLHKKNLPSNEKEKISKIFNQYGLVCTSILEQKKSHNTMTLNIKNSTFLSPSHPFLNFSYSPSSLQQFLAAISYSDYSKNRSVKMIMEQMEKDSTSISKILTKNTEFKKISQLLQTVKNAFHRYDNQSSMDRRFFSSNDKSIQMEKTRRLICQKISQLLEHIKRAKGLPLPKTISKTQNKRKTLYNKIQNYSLLKVKTPSNNINTYWKNIIHLYEPLSSSTAAMLSLVKELHIQKNNFQKQLQQKKEDQCKLSQARKEFQKTVKKTQKHFTSTIPGEFHLTKKLLLPENNTIPETIKTIQSRIQLLLSSQQDDLLYTEKLLQEILNKQIEFQFYKLKHKSSSFQTFKAHATAKKTKHHLSELIIKTIPSLLFKRFIHNTLALKEISTLTHKDAPWKTTQNNRNQFNYLTLLSSSIQQLAGIAGFLLLFLFLITKKKDIPFKNLKTISLITLGVLLIGTGGGTLITTLAYHTISFAGNPISNLIIICFTILSIIWIYKKKTSLNSGINHHKIQLYLAGMITIPLFHLLFLSKMLQILHGIPITIKIAITTFIFIVSTIFPIKFFVAMYNIFKKFNQQYISLLRFSFSISISIGIALGWLLGLLYGGNICFVTAAIFIIIGISSFTPILNRNQHIFLIKQI